MLADAFDTALRGRGPARLAKELEFSHVIQVPTSRGGHVVVVAMKQPTPDEIRNAVAEVEPNLQWIEIEGERIRMRREPIWDLVDTAIKGGTTREALACAEGGDFITLLLEWTEKTKRTVQLWIKDAGGREAVQRLIAREIPTASKHAVAVARELPHDLDEGTASDMIAIQLGLRPMEARAVLRQAHGIYPFDAAPTST